MGVQNGERRLDGEALPFSGMRGGEIVVVDIVEVVVHGVLRVGTAACRGWRGWRGLRGSVARELLVRGRGRRAEAWAAVGLVDAGEEDALLLLEGKDLLLELVHALIAAEPVLLGGEPVALPAPVLGGLVSVADVEGVAGGGRVGERGGVHGCSLSRKISGKEEERKRAGDERVIGLFYSVFSP